MKELHQLKLDKDELEFNKEGLEETVLKLSNDLRAEKQAHSDEASLAEQRQRRLNALTEDMELERQKAA